MQLVILAPLARVVGGSCAAADDNRSGFGSSGACAEYEFMPLRQRFLVLVEKNCLIAARLKTNFFSPIA